MITSDRRLATGVLVATVFVLSACSSSSQTRTHPSAGSSSASFATTSAFDDGQAGVLQPESDPSVLPASLLIADRDNNRLVIVNSKGKVEWEFPRPGDLKPGETFKVPDDAFFSPDGKQIVATQEDAFVVSVIDVAMHKIVYRYGTPGVPGSGPNQLWNPDDAMMLAERIDTDGGHKELPDTCDSTRSTLSFQHLRHHWRVQT